MNNRVLCVDDETHVRDMIVSAVGRFGYEIECAQTAEEAMALFADYDPFIVLADMVLNGGLDGAKMADRMHRQNPLAVMVALTGHMDLYRVGWLLGSVFTDVLQKPVPLKLLKQIIDYAHDKHKRWMEYV